MTSLCIMLRVVLLAAVAVAAKVPSIRTGNGHLYMTSHGGEC